jgi:hypothetical protein
MAAAFLLKNQAARIEYGHRFIRLIGNIALLQL